MHNTFRQITCVVVMLCFTTVADCSEVKIDASTDQSMKDSITAVKESLEADDKGKFENAVITVAMSNVNLKHPDKAKQSLILALNGKTGKEVIALAESIANKRKEKQK